jgi:EAL domain-containing protein (putative c-di-GMP-specific phosphodiesterase class I)
VLSQQAAWRRLDSPVVRVSINIDADHLSRSDFADLVFGALSRHQVRAEYLSLEIAESTLTADLVEVALMLHTLRQRGVHIALDNFGTDWTRLDRLVKLPIDALKLDRSFVRQIGTDRKWQSVASAVVKLAAIRRLEVIAEGVDEPEQLALLTSFGVNAFQGSLFHSPASADHWTALMDQPRPTLSGWESTAAMALFEEHGARDRTGGARPSA